MSFFESGSMDVSSFDLTLLVLHVWQYTGYSNKYICDTLPKGKQLGIPNFKKLQRKLKSKNKFIGTLEGKILNLDLSNPHRFNTCEYNSQHGKNQLESIVRMAGSPQSLKIREDESVSYTHLTLPTNREV